MKDFISDEEFAKMQNGEAAPDFISDDDFKGIQNQPQKPAPDFISDKEMADIKSADEAMTAQQSPIIMPVREEAPAEPVINPNDPRQYQQATPTDINLQAAKQTVGELSKSTPVGAAELGEGALGFGVNVAQDLEKIFGGTNSGVIQPAGDFAKGVLENITENTREYYTGQRNERPIGAEANTANLPESTMTRQKVEDYILKNPNLSENAKQILRAKSQPETTGQAIEKAVTNTPGAQGIINDAKGLVEFITVAPVEGFKAIRIALADSGLIDANTSDEELKQEILKNPMGVFGRIAASAAMGYGAVKGGVKAVDKARTTSIPQTEIESMASKAASEQNLRDTVNKSADYQQNISERNAPTAANPVEPITPTAPQQSGVTFGGKPMRFEGKEPMTVESRVAPEMGVEKKAVEKSLTDKKYKTVPTNEIDVEPERFQFKANTNDKGVADTYKDVKFDESKYEPIFVWRDPADGRYKVVDGHHRFDIAKKSNVPELTVRDVGEYGVKNEVDARIFGAVRNIALDRGTPFDAAKIFREMGINTVADMKQNGISARLKVGRQGLSLSKLSDLVWEGARNNVIPEELAAQLGDKLNHTQQNSVYKQVLQYKNKYGEFPEKNKTNALMDAVNSMEGEGQAEVDMFGNETTTQPVWERAAVVDHIQRELGQDKKAFKVSTNEKIGQRLETTGTGKLDKTKGAQELQSTLTTIDVFNKLKDTKGEIANVLNDAANRIANGENKVNVFKEALNNVKSKIASEYSRYYEGDKPISESGRKAADVRQEIETDMFGNEIPKSEGTGLGMFGAGTIQNAYEYLTGANKPAVKSPLEGDPYYEQRKQSVEATNAAAVEAQKAAEARKPGMGTVLKSVLQDKFSLPQKVLGTAPDRTAAQKVSTAINDIHYKKTFLSSMVNDMTEDIFQPLQSNNITANDFEAYLDANRYIKEIELKEAGDKIDPRKFAAAENLLNNLKKNNPDVFQKMEAAKETMADLWKVHVLDPIYESGIIDKNHYDNLLKNRDYVRFTTADKFLDSLERGSSGTEAGKRIEQLKGTNKEHMDTIWATLQKGASLKSLAIENGARRQFINLFKEMSPDEVTEGTFEKHNFKYFENGEAKYANFKNTDLAKSLNEPHAGITNVPGVSSALSLLSALHKLGTFAYIKLNPAWFVANVALDAGDILSIPIPNSDKMRMLAKYPEILKQETSAVIEGKRSADVRELERKGAIMPQSESFISDAEKAPLEQALGTAADNLKGWLNPDKMTLFDKIKAVANFIAEVPDKAIKPAEAAPKIAAYKTLKDKLPMSELVEKIRETGSPEFLKKGYWTPAFGLGAMFVNPNIQGTARLLKHVSKNPMGATIMMSPFLLAGAARLYNYYFGEGAAKDDAHRHPLRDLVNYTIVTVGGKEVRIPNPRPVRFVLNALAGLSSGDLESFFMRASDIYSDVTPSMAPWLRNLTSIGNAVQGEAPKDFTGKPIVSEDVAKARDSRLWKAVGKQIYNEWFGSLFGYVETDPTRAKEKEYFPQETDTQIYKGFGGQSLHRFVRNAPKEQAWDSLKNDKAKYQDAPKANASLLGKDIGIEYASDKVKYGKITSETRAKMQEYMKTIPPEFRKEYVSALRGEVKKLDTLKSELSNEAKQFVMMSKQDKAAYYRRVGKEKVQQLVKEIQENKKRNNK